MKTHTVEAVSGMHPDTGSRFTHWVEINGEPVRMSQGGIITYFWRHEAEFVAKAKDRRLNG
jgi:hypothetical protein